MIIVLIIILAYLAGIGCTIGLIEIIEYWGIKKFSNKQKTKIAIGSWYSCIILNNLLNNISK